MARVFIRVELKGSPSAETYETLHQYMANNNWYRRINGTGGETPLPTAIYTGTYDGQALALSSALRVAIQANIWTTAALLVIFAETWAQSGWWEPS